MPAQSHMASIANSVQIGDSNRNPTHIYTNDERNAISFPALMAVYVMSRIHMAFKVEITNCIAPVRMGHQQTIKLIFRIYPKHIYTSHLILEKPDCYGLAGRIILVYDLLFNISFLEQIITNVHY
jgi:hypothetical protein